MHNKAPILEKKFANLKYKSKFFFNILFFFCGLNNISIFLNLKSKNKRQSDNMEKNTMTLKIKDYAIYV